MSINQITTDNTFGQLITATAALIAVANNFTDGPQSQTDSTWTFTNAGVGVNVLNTLLATTGNIGVLNLSTGNITNETVGTSNISVANVTVANIDGATITNLISTDHLSANANITGLLQVSDRANIFSANIETANIGTVAITTLSVSELTVPVLNASFANITTLSVTGTSQHDALISVLITTDTANVGVLNCSDANVINETVGTSNISTGNITTLTVGTLNASVANLTTATFPVLNASFANITTETVGTLNATFANITSETVGVMNVSSANITTGTMAANPTSNLQIATKNYVDTGAGANLVNKLSFNAKGDLPVGSGVNTFSIISSGSNGQSLIVDTQTASGLRWANQATQTFRGLVMSTSQRDTVANGAQLIVYNLDEAVMDDGEVVTGWTLPATIDISSNAGAGFLDQGIALANTWYEVYAIRKRSDGTKNFLIHRALDRNPDQNTTNAIFWPTVAGATLGLGANNSSNLYIKLAQSFTPNIAGPLTSIEIRSYRTSTPSGNMWLTLEANTGSGPSGTILATSRKMNVARALLTTGSNCRFIFDGSANVALANSYFWVFNTDYPASATAFMNLVFSLANTAIGANGVNLGLPMGNTGAAWVQLTSIGTFIYKTHVEANSTAVNFPSGYDQKCLISYVSTEANNRIREFHQKDRTITTYFTPHWSNFIFQIAVPEVVDLSRTVPPFPCLISFLSISGGAIQSMGYGRFYALDMVAAIVESGPGITFGVVSGGTTVAPSMPIWIEHQCVLVRIQTASTKIYPCTITF